jgi:serine phosphatase RsbU (regulator of sigma subunit)
MKRNEFFADIGYMSLNHAGEELCGDHVEVLQQGGNSQLIVLADGLGSGVKASILSILTSKIISTMLAANLKLEDAVETIAATLPVNEDVNSAFSTFTIMRILQNERAEIIQYENPDVILLRDGKKYNIPCNTLRIGDKEILQSEIKLQENDIFFLMSDGVLYASDDGVYNDDWDREHVAKFMETFYNIGFTAKTLTTILLDETGRLYGGHPTDDATVCTVRIRRREAVNLAFGPPSSYDDNTKMKRPPC